MSPAMRLERRVLGDGWIHLRRRDSTSISSSFLPPHHTPPGANLSPHLAASSSHHAASSSRGAILPTPQFPPSQVSLNLSSLPRPPPHSAPHSVTHLLQSSPPSLSLSTFNGRCFRCLAMNHLVRHCRSSVRCLKCNNLGHIGRRCSALVHGGSSDDVRSPPSPSPPPPPPPPPSPPPLPPVTVVEQATHVVDAQPYLLLGGGRQHFRCWPCGTTMAIVPLSDARMGFHEGSVAAKVFPPLRQDASPRDLSRSLRPP